MNKKLYVPDHVLKAAKKEKLSKPIENAFKDNNAKEDNKNVEDPSNLRLLHWKDYRSLRVIAF